MFGAIIPDDFIGDAGASRVAKLNHSKSTSIILMTIHFHRNLSNISLKSRIHKTSRTYTNEFFLTKDHLYQNCNIDLSIF